METLTIAEEINQTLENIYNFIKTDEQLNADFTEYKKTLGIYDLNDDKLKEYYVTYIFERNLLGDKNKNPLMMFNIQNGTEISKSMETSFTSIFEIKKILKNGFEVYNMINEKNYILISTAKMTDYRGFGIGQFLVARIFEHKNEFYITEITGHLASNKCDDATRYAMAKIIQEPYLVYENNPEKRQEIENNIKNMYDKFLEAFKTDEIITSSQFADDIIGQFNDFSENGTQINLENKLELPNPLKYFEIKDLNNDYNNFVEKSLNGFSSHKKIYDTAIIYDKEYGLYVIPFYKTLLTILEQNSLENIEGAKECVEYFITSPTVSTNILKRINDKYPNFTTLANEVTENNLTLEELFNEYKPEYVNHKIYSQTTILYNSKVFTSTLNYVVEKEEKSNIDFTKVGRNDKCPCGSGKKFKHCCGK